MTAYNHIKGEDVMKKARKCIVPGLFALMFTVQAQAFQVLPRISDVDRDLVKLTGQWPWDNWAQMILDNGAPLIKNPVHEAITLNALGCKPDMPGKEATCVTTANVAKNQIILYGIRWPDDPPFPLNADAPPRLPGCRVDVTMRSTAQPRCWLGLFRDAEAKGQVLSKEHPDRPAFGPGDYLLYRSHFGDLQFFHSMATHDGETAGETQAKMRTWARFLWEIALGNTPKNKFIRTLDAEGVAQYFPGDMTTQSLFATGIQEVRQDLDKVALGVLLHMVQDSFSQAHTGRAWESSVACEGIERFDQPGKIKKFYSYVGQDGHEHDKRDTFDALAIQTKQHSSNVVDVSRTFVQLWQEKAPWTEAEKYFNCAFALENPEAKADAGDFRK